jgi:hypothetical protein
MVEYKRWNPDAVFAALASASRRELLSRIARKRCRISDLAQGLPVTFAAVSKTIGFHMVVAGFRNGHQSHH